MEQEGQGGFIYPVVYFRRFYGVVFLGAFDDFIAFATASTRLCFVVVCACNLCYVFVFGTLFGFVCGFYYDSVSREATVGRWCFRVTLLGLYTWSRSEATVRSHGELRRRPGHWP